MRSQERVVQIEADRRLRARVRTLAASLFTQDPNIAYAKILGTLPADDLSSPRVAAMIHSYIRELRNPTPPAPLL